LETDIDGGSVLDADYVIKRDTFHYFFNREHRPVLHVKPGDTIKCELSEVSHGQITRNSTHRQVDYDRNIIFPLAGPIYVEGAKPGDSLVVNILSMKTTDWGWSAIHHDIDPIYISVMEGMRDLKGYFLKIWDLSNGRYARFKDEIRVPIRPFCGTMGVAPRDSGNPDARSGLKGEGKDVSAWRHGGNMDIRYLTAGSKLILPVFADGALFSCGDPHAAQGDGELGTAIESSSEVTLSFDVEKKTIPYPRYVTKKEEIPEEGYFGTTGNAPDLMEATKLAARNMIQFLMDKFDLTPEESYTLCGVAADLRIHQCANPPNWTVGLMMPNSVIGIR
jgi:acetamidase/formamidase